MFAALFSFMLLASDPAATAPATAAPATAEAPKEERKICKREPIPGSQYGSKRVCKTAAEWKAYNQRDVEVLQDHRSKGY